MIAQNYFIEQDEYEGIEQQCRRSAIAHFYLAGNGIEIGALHKPLQIPADRCNIRYVDYKTTEENRLRYPELIEEGIVDTDIIDNGFILNKVEDNTCDFIIANHALEHSPDPYGTLLTWLHKLTSNGVIYVAIPIAEKCYDKGRPTTTLQHLVTDHTLFTSLRKNDILAVTADHIEEFITVSDANIRVMNGMQEAGAAEKSQLQHDLMLGLKAAVEEGKNYDDLITAHITRINRIYDIHYHTFSPSSYELFLQYFCRQTGAMLENVVKNGNGECIGIIRKR